MTIILLLAGIPIAFLFLVLLGLAMDDFTDSIIDLFKSKLEDLD